MFLEALVWQWYMLAAPLAIAFAMLFRVARRQVLPSADWPQAISAIGWAAFAIYDAYISHIVMYGVRNPIRSDVPKLMITLAMLSAASLVSLALAFFLLRDIPVNRRRPDPTLMA